MNERDNDDDEAGDPSSPPVLKFAIEGLGSPSFASYAKAVVRARARLRRMFAIDIVNGPAFDMILRIFVANEGAETLSVTALGIAAEVPHASAVRWVDILEAHGIVRRVADPCDGRRRELVLTPEAVSVLREWLADISSIPLRRE